MRKRKALADLFKHLSVIGMHLHIVSVSPIVFMWKQIKSVTCCFIFIFKIITGLSYRKGLMALRKDEDPCRDMTNDPLDVDAALSQLSETGADQETKKSWSGCQKYMLRCLARRALFHSAMNTPAQVPLLTVDPSLAPRP